MSDDGKMRVTLLSGFLGAGKTTLLKRILRLNNERADADKLKIAIIVNDMGEINLDADEIKDSKLIQEDAEMVEMHNGCICCTLRGDLLKTVKSLTQEAKYDYLVIESTGISEPLPVAQTFVMDVDQEEEDAAASEYGLKKLAVATSDVKSLSNFATLDTLVTVVDALNIFDVLSSLQTLADKNNIAGMLGNTGAADDKTADNDEGAKVDQPENLEKGSKVWILSGSGKWRECSIEETDLDDRGIKIHYEGFATVHDEWVVKDTFAKRLRASKPLHADCDHDEGDEDEVDDRSIAQLMLEQIEFANVIVVSKAAMFVEKEGEAKLLKLRALLQRLSPKARVVVPKANHYADMDVAAELLNTGLFDMEEAEASVGWLMELEKEEHTPETEEYGISSTVFRNNSMPFHPQRLASLLSGFGHYKSALEVEGNTTSSSRGGHGKKEEKETVAAVATGGADQAEKAGKAGADGPFLGVVRSKGRLWLANAHATPLDFHTAGRHLDITANPMPFLASLPEGAWGEAERAACAQLEAAGKWHAEWGDHESELVFIGVHLDKAAIHEQLTAALLTKEESAALGGVQGWRGLDDPFFCGQCADHYFELDDEGADLCGPRGLFGCGWW